MGGGGGNKNGNNEGWAQVLKDARSGCSEIQLLRHVAETRLLIVNFVVFFFQTFPCFVDLYFSHFDAQVLCCCLRAGAI